MKVKVTLLPLLVLVTAFFAGCATPVSIDPMADQKDHTAEYRAGFFYAPIDANAGRIFRTAIRELDAMGYFRTGELHDDAQITIYARKVGDERVTVRIEQIAPGQSEIRIRVGRFGNLPESQRIYAQIRGAI